MGSRKWTGSCAFPCLSAATELVGIAAGVAAGWRRCQVQFEGFLELGVPKMDALLLKVITKNDLEVQPF